MSTPLALGMSRAVRWSSLKCSEAAVSLHYQRGEHLFFIYQNYFLKWRDMSSTLKGSFKVTEPVERRKDTIQLPQKKERKKKSKLFGSRVVENMAKSCLCGCLSELECENRRAYWTGGRWHNPTKRYFVTQSETPREKSEQPQVWWIWGDPQTEGLMMMSPPILGR